MDFEFWKLNVEAGLIILTGLSVLSNIIIAIAFFKLVRPRTEVLQFCQHEHLQEEAEQLFDQFAEEYRDTDKIYLPKGAFN